MVAEAGAPAPSRLPWAAGHRTQPGDPFRHHRAMTPDGHHGPPTPRTTPASRYVAVRVWCKSCRHQADADL
jgi:hypothetical protein